MAVKWAVVFGMVLLSFGCGRRSAPAPPAAVRKAGPVTLPAGTTVSLKTVLRIEAAGSVPAQGFPAVVVGDLKDASGATIASSGSPARLVILRKAPAQLGLAAILVEGNWRSVSPVSGSDEAVGGGAPLGTLVRGLLETRAGQNAAAGSMAIRTSGTDVQVPAGTLLVFRLDEPLQAGLSTR